MARKALEQNKEKMWQLYQDCKVAKKVKHDPVTVSKYAQELKASVRTTQFLIPAQGNNVTFYSLHHNRKDDLN